MVYVVLNTMIWSVVKLTGGKVTPSNWHEKEVYDWGLGARDLPGWVRYLQRNVLPARFQTDGRKDGVELVDNDSAIHGATDTSSRGNSAEDKEMHGLQEHPHPGIPLHVQIQSQPREHILPSLD